MSYLHLQLKPIDPPPPATAPRRSDLSNDSAVAAGVQDLFEAAFPVLAPIEKDAAGVPENTGKPAAYPIATVPRLQRQEEALPEKEAPKIPQKADGLTVKTEHPAARQPATMVLPTAVPTLPRHEVQPASVHLEVTQIATARNEFTGKERIAANRTIRHLKEGHQGFPRPPYRWTDLHGKVIGNIVERPDNRANSELEVLIGPREYILGAYFGFASRVYTPPDSKRSDLCLRATAYLTESGIERVQRYLKTYLRDSYTRTGARGITIRPNKADIRDMLKRRDTFDVKIDDTLVHLNQRGKAEVFVPINSNALNLVGEPPPGDRRRSSFFSLTNASPLKLWIDKTDKDFNRTLRDAFFTLGRALNGILGDPTQE